MSDVTEYLLERDLIHSDAVVDGGLTVVDMSSRNDNFKVSADGATGLFLKQGRPRPTGAGPWEAARDDSLAHEAAVYRLFDEIPRHGRSGGLTGALPASCGYDSQHRLLILESVDGAQDLGFYHARTRRFSVTLATRLGRVIADLHEVAFPLARRRPEDFAVRMPWVLALDRPGTAFLREASNAGLELVQILQSTPQLRRTLAELRTEWHASAFIHHDLKWENCLVVPAGPSRRRTRLAIIDWEFADLGDCCWDTGSIFANYLSCWLTSIPVTGQDPPDRYLELAGHPLERMQPAMRAFWTAYVEARRWDTGTADGNLVRSARFAGARLLQTAYERTQAKVHLDGNDVVLVQLAVNVLSRPREAAHHLLGVSLSHWNAL